MNKKINPERLEAIVTDAKTALEQSIKDYYKERDLDVFAFIRDLFEALIQKRLVVHRDNTDLEEAYNMINLGVYETLFGFLKHKKATLEIFPDELSLVLSKPLSKYPHVFIKPLREIADIYKLEFSYQVLEPLNDFL
ncbi:hypothetical protein J7L02_01915 [Candidatus Woesearchaeota archaeon]|nr:hypothetical protein [Candidatus Woesearchaeota archaeon]